MVIFMKKDLFKAIIKTILIFVLFNYSWLFQLIPVFVFNIDVANLSGSTNVLLNAFSSIRVLEIQECEEEISEKVKEEFFNNVTVRSINVKHKNDKVICMLAFIFDINFEESFKIIKEEGFIDKFYDAIEHKEIFKEYFDYANNYLEKVLSRNVG